MAIDFAAIKITGLNDEASGPSEQGAAMTRVVLELSASAPAEWSSYFNQRWQQHIYTMKRRAHVSGSRLEIDCVLDELEADHLPELCNVVAETNKEYAKYHAAKNAAQAAEKQRREAEAERLAQLKKNINFD